MTLVVAVFAVALASGRSVRRSDVGEGEVSELDPAGPECLFDLHGDLLLQIFVSPLGVIDMRALQFEHDGLALVGYFVHTQIQSHETHDLPLVSYGSNLCYDTRTPVQSPA